MSVFATYKPSSIVIALSHPATNTNHIVGGLVKDNPVTIEYPDATWTNKTLNNGELVRTHSKDNNVRLTVNVDQTSATNDYFEALADYDERDPTGLDGIFTCTFADKSSRATAYSATCFIQRPQTYEYGSDTNAREWVIVLANADKYMGGAGRLDPDLVAALEAFGINIEDRWKI
jgi:hypothetical protein